MAKWRGTTYSGFNMGAGEDGLLELLSACLDCPEGTLVLVDEIELGLHETAQERLMLELKDLCYSRKLQIICTTHSGRILESLPPQGRILIERVDKSTRVTVGPSAKLATGRVVGRQQVEVSVIVEDDVSEALVLAALSYDARARSKILPVGSKGAVLRSLATHYCEGCDSAYCAVLDGDAEHELRKLCRSFLGLLEGRATPSARRWFLEHVAFLPGGIPPETWLLGQDCDEFVDHLARELGMEAPRLRQSLEEARTPAHHDSLYELAQAVHVGSQELVLRHLCLAAWECEPAAAKGIEDFIIRCIESS